MAIKNCSNSSKSFQYTLLTRENQELFKHRKVREQNSILLNVYYMTKSLSLNPTGDVSVSSSVLWTEKQFCKYVQKIYEPTHICTRPPTHPSVCYSFVAVTLLTSQLPNPKASQPGHLQAFLTWHEIWLPIYDCGDTRTQICLLCFLFNLRKQNHQEARSHPN